MVIWHLQVGDYIEISATSFLLPMKVALEVEKGGGHHASRRISPSKGVHSSQIASEETLRP